MCKLRNPRYQSITLLHIKRRHGGGNGCSRDNNRRYDFADIECLFFQARSLSALARIVRPHIQIALTGNLCNHSSASSDLSVRLLEGHLRSTVNELHHAEQTGSERWIIDNVLQQHCCLAFSSQLYLSSFSQYDGLVVGNTNGHWCDGSQAGHDVGFARHVHGSTGIDDKTTNLCRTLAPRRGWGQRSEVRCKHCLLLRLLLFLIFWQVRRDDLSERAPFFFFGGMLVFVFSDESVVGIGSCSSLVSSATIEPTTTTSLTESQ